jgi:trans-2,3-dihydro-3-hydroxyanthranilate isomerase
MSHRTYDFVHVDVFTQTPLAGNPLAMFFYGGEDSAIGSAAGCAASWMVQNGVAKNDEQVVIRQGVDCRRPSEMHVRATREGGRVTNVRVGGYAVEILRGTVVL